MVGGVQTSAEDENNKKQRDDQGQISFHQLSRKKETQPAECYTKKQDGEIHHPDAGAEDTE